jgi:hypothetical protein
MGLGERPTVSRQLLRTYWVLALLMLAGVVAVLAVGGRPDPSGPAWVLDGSWRFHPRDDLRWADPKTDDNDWEQIRLVSLASSHDLDVGLPGYLAGWRARGHADLVGYGWYRRRVALPANQELRLLGPTMVDDGYEMFWDGKRVGGSGALGEGRKITGVRPFVVRLPRPANAHSALLAVRTFMQPWPGRDNQSGGLRSVPTLAAGSFGEQLHRAQWWRSIAGYIVEVALPATMVLLAGIAIIQARSTARPSFARWLSIALTATALLRLGNAVSAWTELLDVTVIYRVNTVLLSPLAMLSWTAAWNDWANGRGRRGVLAIALVASIARVVATIVHADPLVPVVRLLFVALFAVIAVRIWVHGERRWLALGTLGVIAVALFVNELRQLGIPDIWFPFNIGVTLTQYAYAMALPLIAWLLATRRPEHPLRSPATVAAS